VSVNIRYVAFIGKSIADVQLYDGVRPHRAKCYKLPTPEANLTRFY
jgi:hypothetical protein